MIKYNGHVITPTIFPDKTSQIWHIPFEEILFTHIGKIEWDFEHEGEMIQVLQLAELLRFCCGRIELYMPFLPYGRQDKRISNNSAFALSTFLDVLEKSGKFYRIETLDIHSSNAKVINISPDRYIKDVINKVQPNLICFPDKGASARGYDTQGIPGFSLDKVRNQQTGEIEGLCCPLPLDLVGKSILIVDDLCDRGGTFMKACKLLKDMGAKEVNLYTTHGLYTGGVDIIFESGINRIFNYKGEVFSGK